MGRCVIGYDVGSQGAKAVICSDDGCVLATASCEYPISYPRPAWAEQNPQHWMDALRTVTRAVLDRAGPGVGPVVGLGLDAYVDSIVPVDEGLRPLREAFLWMDRRAVQQCEWMSRAISPDRLFEITGLNLDPSHTAAKILWVRDNEPGVFERTWKFVVPATYLVGWLTGGLVVDFSNASSTMLLDVRTRRWSGEVLAALGLSEDLLVPVRSATDVAGELREDVANELGLPPGIPVVVGCGDEHAACVGAGVVEPGVVGDIGGTAEPVAVAARAPAFDSSRLVETHCHAAPEMWLLENPGFVSGANLRWYRDTFGEADVSAAEIAGVDAYEILTNGARAVPPGSDGLVFLPCMMGAMTPEWNANARGVLYGLTLHHGRHHVVRAILEGSAYGLRDIIDGMRVAGVECSEVRAVGGQARSALWRQIKADVTGIPVVRLATDETSCLGAALLAAVASGLFPSLRDAIDVFVQPVEVLYPDERAHATYEKAYQLYRQIYTGLKPAFDSGSR